MEKSRIIKLKRKAGRGITKVFLAMNQCYIFCVCHLYQMLGRENPMDEFMKSMCASYEKYSDYYAVYKYRPKKAKDIISMEEENAIDKKIGIIIQGPVFLKDHFTLETVRTYGKIFPSAKIIVSTCGGGGRQ